MLCMDGHVNGVDPQVDRMIGGIFIVLGGCGAVGNTLFCIYFLVRGQRNCLTFLLYCLASFTNIAICVLHLPTTLALFRDRVGGIYCNGLFCGFWRNTFKTMQRLNIALVLIISVTRTVVIAKPFVVMSRRKALTPLLGYVTYIAIETIILVPFQDYEYGSGPVYCYEVFNNSHPLTVWSYALNTASLGLPALAIFFSFVVAIYHLNKSSITASPANPEHGNRRRHKASLTVLLFTFIFMVCNVPYFLNLVVWSYQVWVFGEEQPYESAFLQHYSWTLSDLMGLLVNAVAGSVLYWKKIGPYRTWIMSCLRCRSTARTNTTSI